MSAEETEQKEEANTDTQSAADDAAVESATQALDQAEQALDTLGADDSAERFRLEDLVGDEKPPEKCSIELLRDVDLDLKIELGRTHMVLEDVLKLRQGSVVTLDKLAGDPVDLFVNGRLVAKGEILVLNDNFCVRIAQLMGSDHLIE